jgi:hypothetical protein
MFLSPGTAKAHLLHIFAKLGTPSRSHLAAEATKPDSGPVYARIDADRMFTLYMTPDSDVN